MSSQSDSQKDQLMILGRDVAHALTMIEVMLAAVIAAHPKKEEIVELFPAFFRLAEHDLKSNLAYNMVNHVQMRIENEFRRLAR